jgi:hypothetical protein
MTDENGVPLSNGKLTTYRLDQIEKRVGRIENILIGILGLMAMVTLTYVVTSVGLPAP